MSCRSHPGIQHLHSMVLNILKHGLWEVFISRGKGCMNSMIGVYDILLGLSRVIGNLLRIVVGRMEKIVNSHEL